MNQTRIPINVRIDWCRQQSALASTEPEADGWRAEEDGLRDALMNSDHTHEYRSYPTKIYERYVLGFQDGTALLRAARVERMARLAVANTSRPADRMGENFLGSKDQ